MYANLYERIVPFCENNNVEWALLMHGTEFLLHDSPFKCEKEFIKALHKEENELFDIDVYTDPEIKDVERKKVVGYFLDEYSDNFEVVAYIGLAAKSYCYVLKDIRARDEEGNVITKIYKEEKKMHEMKLGDGMYGRRIPILKNNTILYNLPEDLFNMSIDKPAWTIDKSFFPMKTIRLTSALVAGCSSFPYRIFFIS